MKQKIKIIKTLIIIFSLCFSFSANAQTAEEIIKGINLLRLGNNPVKINGQDIYKIISIK